MNELSLRPETLPDTIEDLAKFVLVGREKLVSVRAEIRAISKLNLANDVLQQKKDEAIMLGNAIIDAETRVGELTKALPKASGGDRRSEDFKMSGEHHFEKSKSETTADLGLSQHQVKQFEKLADNPEAVEQAKQEAINTGTPVTRASVIKIIDKKGEEIIDRNFDNLETFRKALTNPSLYKLRDKDLIKSIVVASPNINDIIGRIDRYIQELQAAKENILKEWEAQAIEVRQ